MGDLACRRWSMLTQHWDLAQIQVQEEMTRDILLCSLFSSSLTSQLPLGTAVSLFLDFVLSRSGSSYKGRSDFLYSRMFCTRHEEHIILQIPNNLLFPFTYKNPQCSPHSLTDVVAELFPSKFKWGRLSINEA
jgi:hypothetical protein